MAAGSCEPTRRVRCWLAAGIPVMGSRRVLRWAMDHDGEMRRSERDWGALMRRGTSAAGWRDMIFWRPRISSKKKGGRLGVVLGRAERAPIEGGMRARGRGKRGRGRMGCTSDTTEIGRAHV